MILDVRAYSFPKLSKFCLLSALLLTVGILPGKGDETPAPSPKTAAVTADAVQEAFVRISERIKPSVVTIYAERASQPVIEKDAGTPKKPNDENDATPGNPNEKQPEDDSKSPFSFTPDDPDDDRTSLGTGMVISMQGQILTNYHVVKDAAFIRILFDAGDERSERPLARLVGFDEESDLAVLQLAPGTPRHTTLRPVEFADSDAVRVGEWAIAMGAPFDQTQTVTVGIISAKGRHLNKGTRLSLQDYIQTDASINPGNSGGPLINLEGKVIGINTAILSPSRFNVGIGFAVPSNAIQRYLPILAAGKSVGRGFLGIQYAAVDDEVAREFNVAGGMQIGALAKRGEEFIGPAKNAGLQEGDIITQVNGRTIITSDEFRSLVAGSAPGTTLNFTVVRPDATTNVPLELKVTLADWSSQDPDKATIKPPSNAALPKASPLGMTVDNADAMTLAHRDRLGLSIGTSGAIITDIVPGSPADTAELQRGLRLVRARIANGKWQELTNKESFQQLEKSLKAGDRVLLQVRDRQNVSLYKVLILTTG